MRTQADVEQEQQERLEQSEFYQELLKQFIDVYGEDALTKIQKDEKGGNKQ